MMNEILNVRPHTGKNQMQDWVRTGRLYALVDPFFEIPSMGEKRALQTRDTDPVFYELIAWDKVTYEPPALISVNEDTLDWLLHTLSTERWGVFVVSSLPLRQLAEHLQKFVIARGPDQNPYFLRFHDASVLEVLLDTWSENERQTFFGPLEAFCLPNLDTMDVHIWNNPNPAHLRVLPKPEDCLLTLRETQLLACADAIDRDLVKIIYWHLRNYHARSVQHLSRPLLERRIFFAIARARRYALSSVSDLAGFTALMFELAPNFDEHPSFHRVLVDPNLPPNSKMKRLSQVITDREWEEALRLYDRNFWVAALEKTPGSDR
jgi:hypothetical protein